MLTHLYLDIESIPAQRPDVLAEIRAAKQAALDTAIACIAPPGNYKKPETIEEWFKNEAPKVRKGLEDAFESDVDDEYRRTGLDGSFGQIAVVSYAIDNGPAGAFYRPTDPMSLASEREILQELRDTLTDEIQPSSFMSVCVVGHNVSAFDLRFLAQRSIIHGIRPHIVIARAAQAKPWEIERVYDTMVQWCGAGGKAKLDKLCRALGLPGKDGFDGSKVWDAVKSGEIEKVAQYCNGDVERVRAVHQRMTYATAPVFDDVPA